MLISHEVPISLLEESKSFNDYDYCLLHLTYESREYLDFYKNSVKEGRKVLLDNSLFELGDSLTNKQLHEGVMEIKPTWYVVPDCLNNAKETMKRFANYTFQYSNDPGLKIGVVQGNTLSAMVGCYQFMSRAADKIAIPFDSAAFTDLYPGLPKLEAWQEGRRYFIKYLIDKGLWSNKPHHLLGCSVPKEFFDPIYKTNIESIDTSNPVVAGICGLKYNKFGLSSKPSIKLCDLISIDLSDHTKEIVRNNVKRFREIANDQTLLVDLL